jgi:hypothetical protein
VGSLTVDAVLGVAFGPQNRARLGNKSGTPGWWPRLRHAHPQNRRVRYVMIGPDDCSMFGVRNVHHIRYGGAMCHVWEGSDHINNRDRSILLSV